MTSKDKGDTWPKVLAYNYDKYGDTHKAMRYKHYGIWQAFTWKDYYLDVKYLALGLLALGFEPGDKLLIVGDNAPQWGSAELAAQANRGVSVGVFPDLSLEELRAVASESDARFAIVEGQEQVDKLLEIKETLPLLRKVIYWNYKGLTLYADPLLSGYREVLDLGMRFGEPERFEHNVAEGSPDDVCALVYTSGAEFAPRCAVHTYGTLRAGADAYMFLDAWNERDEVVPAAPPALITGQWAAIGCHLLSGCILNFAEDLETLRRDALEIEPTIALYGARFWESQAAAVRARMIDLDTVKKLMFRLLMPVGERRADLKLHKRNPGIVTSLLHSFADLILFRHIRRALGLSRARVCVSTGALLSPDAMRLYHALGLPVKSLYATTEGGVLAGPLLTDAVGPLLPGCEARIIDGEITYRGPGVFMGYYRDIEKTASVLKDGWISTGDAGLIEDGCLRFIDRKESLIRMPSGDILGPQAVESALRFSPYIKDAWVFAGGALIVINFATVARWAGKRKIAFSTFAELAQTPEVYDLIKADLERVNKDLPPSCRITRYVNLHKEFDPDAGELTRTLNLKRKVLAERYRGIVDAIRAGTTSVEVQDGRGETILTIRGVAP